MGTPGALVRKHCPQWAVVFTSDDVEDVFLEIAFAGVMQIDLFSFAMAGFPLFRICASVRELAQAGPLDESEGAYRVTALGREEP